MTPPPVAESLLCPQCGYDLRAIESERCPECGSPIDRNAMAQSQIPWTHRRQIGWWRAYRQTVAMVLVHPKKIAAEIARPVSYRDAQLFRWTSVLTAFIGLAASALVLWYRLDNWSRRHASFEPYWQWLPQSIPETWGFVTILAAILIALVLLTGVQSYFFHPRCKPILQQNRALALSYYPSALLIPFTSFVLLAGVCNLADDWFPTRSYVAHGGLTTCQVVALFMAAIFALDYFAKVCSLMSRTLHVNFLRPLLAILSMILFPIIAVLLILILPALLYAISPIFGW